MSLRSLLPVLLVALFICCLSAAFAAGPGSIENGERPFSRVTFKCLTGKAYEEHTDKAITIKGIPYDTYCCSEYYGERDQWATYDIRGWDKFVALIGINDNYVGISTKVTIEVDGDTITNFTARSGEKAVSVEIPLTNCKTITFRSTNLIVFANPRVIKGDAPPLYKCPQCVNTFTSQQALSDHIKAVHGGTTGPGAPPATFVVDPGDLDKLATSLRKRIDGKAELKDSMAKGFMSVMTFNLIDIPSPSVAQNVAEDIATKLINADFRLVERGQLDKALKELKIQDSALIDQKTAQQLGQITGCNYILVGSVSDRGQFIVMNSRILETATGIAVAAESVECRKIKIDR
ncbi:MAG: FlgO family outer membrane protein [bacterium]